MLIRILIKITAKFSIKFVLFFLNHMTGQHMDYNWLKNNTTYNRDGY